VEDINSGLVAGQMVGIWQAAISLCTISLLVVSQACVHTSPQGQQQKQQVHHAAGIFQLFMMNIIKVKADAYLGNIAGFSF
jgi:hypothetical protein